VEFAMQRNGGRSREKDLLKRGMLPLAEVVIRIEMQAMYSAVCLEKFALTETAGYSACANGTMQV
jgi:hypothetical protein